MSRACCIYGENRNAYRTLAGKPEERDHQEDVRGCIILKWTGWGGVEWIDLAQD
jgi:hypothetical protein